MKPQMDIDLERLLECELFHSCWMEMMHYGKIVTLAQIYNIIKMQEEITLT